jgi:DNA-directed RNA polymerase specialized sigma24 family protein
MDVRSERKGLAGEMPAATNHSPQPTGFDEFYRRYFLPLVRRSSWKHGLDKEDARDVVQEAFMIALAKLDPERNPRAWLIQVVDHLSLNFQRKAFRRAKLVTKWSPSVAGMTLNVAESDENVDEAVDNGGDDYY